MCVAMSGVGRWRWCGRTRDSGPAARGGGAGVLRCWGVRGVLAAARDFDGAHVRPYFEADVGLPERTMLRLAMGGLVLLRCWAAAQRAAAGGAVAVMRMGYVDRQTLRALAWRCWWRGWGCGRAARVEVPARLSETASNWRHF